MLTRPLIAALLFTAGTLSSPAVVGDVDPPILTADTQFPVIGTVFTVQISGSAGDDFFYLAALKPSEASLGAKGTLFLDPAIFFIVFSGTLPGSGAIDLPLALPNLPEAAGLFFYMQGAIRRAGVTKLGNALAFRVEDSAPSGARNPVAVAVTPDGVKAYVANATDASLSVIDTQSDAVLADIPVGERPTDVAVDPEGRHVFVVNGESPFLTVIDVATDSVVAQLAVPAASRRVAFDFAGGTRRIYVTNARDDNVLVFDEAVSGGFTALPALALAGRGPEAIEVLADGRLAVALRGTSQLEIVDPSAPPGSGPDGIVQLEGVPQDVLLAGSQILVPLFGFGASPPSSNRLKLIDATSLLPTGLALEDVGTDYLDVAPAGTRIVVVGAGSGTVVVADAASLAELDHLDLAPSDPNATPQRAAWVPPIAEGTGGKLYVANYFRDTIRTILLDSGPPFALGGEIVLAFGGAPRVPLSDLTPEEDGNWFFRSVEFLNGTPLNPNNVTCATCHPAGGSDNITHGRQTPPLFGAGDTAPYGWGGAEPDLLTSIQATFTAHSQFGGSPPPFSDQLILQYLVSGNPAPPSPFLQPGGALNADQQAGQALFEGSAGCSDCHVAPIYIPQEPTPLTFSGGVGTGLAPANVPSLRGLWSTAPYFHDGSAATLEDVLLKDTAGQHGVTSSLSGADRDALVAFLQAL